ncbi:hypothetical protein C1H46_024457 [Malus baccata]|uniref:Uncharacterized protein n=1 Tax=Malus baccata TaxID=106549 RepID=A0A540LTY7_MALBA|nr:hypothetical protein C1H46_024457 [Malus baccata]
MYEEFPGSNGIAKPLIRIATIINLASEPLHQEEPNNPLELVMDANFKSLFQFHPEINKNT